MGRVRLMIAMRWDWWTLMGTPNYVVQACIDELNAQVEQQRQSLGGGEPRIEM